MPKKKTYEKFKALITADLHLSNGLPHAQPTHDGLTDRFEDQLRVLQQIKEVGTQEEVDAVFLLGDVFDKRLLDAVTLRHSLEAFRNLEPLPVYVLPGNHDAHSQVGERFVSEVLRGEVTGWGHVEFMDAGDQLDFELENPWLTFWALPYGPLDVTRARLAKYRKSVVKAKGPDKIDILLMHHSVVDAVHLGWKCDAGLTAAEATESFDYVFAGHFHKEQEFPGAEDRGRYIGAPMQLHYGEEGYPPELHVVTFNRDPDSDIFSMKGFPTETPKFFTRAGIDEIPCRKGDYLKVQIEATHAEWATMQAGLQVRCKTLEGQGIHVKLVHKVVYHHEERLGEVKIEVGGMPELIGGYVDAAEVVTRGVGKKTLKKLGLDILEEARTSKGSSA